MIGIVSGLERSGTSMMMQILEAGGISVAYDNSRPANKHNPRGYYELEGGKVITALMESRFAVKEYDGSFVKVTAYGLNFLPYANYRIIYMRRNLDEVLASQRQMGATESEYLAAKLDYSCLKLVQRRFDMQSTIVWYNDVLGNPEKEMSKLRSFLGNGFDIDRAIAAIDDSLYRNRRVDNDRAIVS